MARVISEVSIAAEALQRGELVAFATETVYGLGGVALWPPTVARIFEAKGRPTFDPLIVHVPDLRAVRELVTEFPPLAERLARTVMLPPATCGSRPCLMLFSTRGCNSRVGTLLPASSGGKSSVNCRRGPMRTDISSR